jgi:hypothetical protein
VIKEFLRRFQKNSSQLTGTEYGERKMTPDKSVRKTYLELSTRKSGKTARLKAAILKQLESGDAILQTFRYPWTRQIADDIKRTMTTLHCANQRTLPGRLYTIQSCKQFVDMGWEPVGYNNPLRGVTFNNPRLFVDEFQSINKDDLMMVDGSYYVGDIEFSSNSIVQDFVVWQESNFWTYWTTGGGEATREPWPTTNSMTTRLRRDVLTKPTIHRRYNDGFFDGFGIVQGERRKSNRAISIRNPDEDMSFNRRVPRNPPHSK